MLRNSGVGFCRLYLLSYPIRIFYLWDGKSPLAWLKAVSGTNIFIVETGKHIQGVMGVSYNTIYIRIAIRLILLSKDAVAYVNNTINGLVMDRLD